MVDADRSRDFDDIRLTAGAAVALSELRQMASGLAGVYAGSAAAASGDSNCKFKTSGQYVITKTSGVVILDGGKVYWDHSANAATYKAVNDRDFFVGTAVGDAASVDVTMTVNLNVEPQYLLDIARDPFVTAIVKTAGAPLLNRRGGTHNIVLDSTNEAQKVDALSKDGFSKDANAIIELAFCVANDGAGTTPDVSMGIANATHATDADTIAESLFVHLDGNNVNIYLESDDGTTEVAATDSTIDYTESQTSRVEVWFDMRNPADIQAYINGVNVLPASVFNLNVATGPLRLLIHVEKTAAADVYEIDVDWLRARIAEQ